MGAERRGPTAARVVAGSSLDTGRQVPKRGVLAVAEVSLRTRPACGVEVAADTAQDRFEDHASAVVEVADHLVAGDERERDKRFEVACRAAVHGGQVRAADARQAWSDPHPVGARGLGFIKVDQFQGTGRSSPSGSEASGHPGSRVARQVSPELQGFHRLALICWSPRFVSGRGVGGSGTFRETCGSLRSASPVSGRCRRGGSPG